MATSGKKSDSQTVSVDGHRLTLTNLDKVMYPATGTTKGEVIEYYAGIAEVLIPHARNRPATRKRWVHGVGTAQKPGMMFFQKNLDDGTPSWVTRRTIEHKNHRNEYPLVNDLATLTWLAQIAALELHVPQWQFGRTGTQKNPDRLVLDLDPGDGAGLQECAEVARFARAILRDMGLDPLPVTSGSKGIHLYAALDGKQSSDEVSAVAHELARALEADHPDLIVSDMKKTQRTGKVLVDWSQNNGSKTTIAPYSLRGREHPMVAAPRTWRELASSTLEQLDFREVLARVKRRGDPLAALSAGHLASLEPTPDKLARYRGMRDPAKTPEPVPAGPAPTSNGQSFVIQEHHARRLHYDFRLERDGVLVSWALPKGTPTDQKKNHLAVQTEDHPLDYGSFEGSIPAGEYGAGEVRIWDEGEYELEKWREDEVIVTLQGTKKGGLGPDPQRFALIHTGGEGKAAQNWLIHLMAPGSAPAKHHHARSSAPSTAASKPGGARAARSYSPMLATSAEGSASLPEAGELEEWAFEMKWDGIRAIAYVDDSGIRLVTRNGNDVTRSYPEVVDEVESVAAESSAVLDGEVVALDGSGRPDFGRLQSRMNLTKEADVERARKSVGVHYFVFDLLELDGKSLLKESYDARRDALDAVVSDDPTRRIQAPPAFDGDLDAALAASKSLRLEGVMAKKRESTYSSGRRSRAWRKLKLTHTQEVVIIGWRTGTGRREDTIGSLLMAVPGTNGELEYAGRVGTGFRDDELEELRAQFDKAARATPPANDVPNVDARDAHWITPSRVGEVEYGEWTATGRLRQPSWRGWRPDKSPSEVVREG